MATKFPKNNLDAFAQPFLRAVTGAIHRLEADAERRKEAGLNTDKGATADFKTIAGQVRDLRDVVNRLVSVATAVSSETISPPGSGFAGFFGGDRPTVSIVSPTGRLQVDFGGSLNGGTGYFVYSISSSISGVIVDRAPMQSNPAKRVAITGGSSFAPSGYRSAFETVPANEPLTITLEMFASDAFTYFFGGSITARPSL